MKRTGMNRACVRTIFLVPFFMGAMGSMVVAQEKEVTAKSNDRSTIELTVYQGGVAQVRDERMVSFANGQQRLHFEDVASSIMPQTSLFQAEGVSLLEQNYDYDLLTPAKLLEKSVGSSVWVSLQNPVTGEERRERALVLSANGPAILKMGDRIEVLGPDHMSGRISFDKIPENLRAKPTLSLLVDSDKKGKQTTTLTYLTRDIGWQADYIATLNRDETAIDLQAWITLNNQSGLSFDNATINVVAGDVNLVQDAMMYAAPMMDAVEEVVVNRSRIAKEEALSDYIQYSIPFKSSVLNNQQKQLALFHVNQVPVQKRYKLSGYGTSSHAEGDFASAQLELIIKNDKNTALGKGLPSGVFRLYALNAADKGTFVGEERVANTPVGRDVHISYGRAFNVTSHVDAKELNKDCWLEDKRQFCVREYELTINLKNALKKEIDVDYRHVFNGEFDLLSANVKPEKVSGNDIKWSLPIKAEGETVLTLRIKTGALSRQKLRQEK